MRVNVAIPGGDIVSGMSVGRFTSALFYTSRKSELARWLAAPPAAPTWPMPWPFSSPDAQTISGTVIDVWLLCPARRPVAGTRLGEDPRRP